MVDWKKVNEATAAAAPNLTNTNWLAGKANTNTQSEWALKKSIFLFLFSCIRLIFIRSTWRKAEIWNQKAALNWVFVRLLLLLPRLNQLSSLAEEKKKKKRNSKVEKSTNFTVCTVYKRCTRALDFLHFHFPCYSGNQQSCSSFFLSRLRIYICHERLEQPQKLYGKKRGKFGQSWKSKANKSSLEQSWYSANQKAKAKTKC